MARAMSDDAAFNAFAASVLQTAKPDSNKVAALRSDVDAWYVRYHTIIDRSLPNPAWGLGRLDAVGMIFNRVTGLGIGPEPSFLIPENIHRADAPVPLSVSVERAQTGQDTVARICGCLLYTSPSPRDS